MSGELEPTQPEWTPAFPGQRPPFPTKHGAYATGKLAPRAAEIADAIRELVPASSSSDGPAIEVLARIVARIEVVDVWLEENGIFRAGGKGDPQPILKMLSVWENSALRTMAALGMTPTSRAQLGLRITRAKGEALRAHLEEHYSESGNEPPSSSGSNVSG